MKRPCTTKSIAIATRCRTRVTSRVLDVTEHVEVKVTNVWMSFKEARTCARVGALLERPDVAYLEYICIYIYNVAVF